jgi:hypothetical protein
MLLPLLLPACRCCCCRQVRNQRNKFVALIAAAGQASVEMGDRLKLLASEQEILATNLAAKAKLLTKVHGQQQLVIMMRMCQLLT